MADTQGPELVSDTVTGAWKDREVQRGHGGRDAELTFVAGWGVGRIGVAEQEGRDEGAQTPDASLVDGGDALEAAEGFDAVVDGAEAGLEPDVQRGCEGECGVEDDELRASEGFGEVEFLVVAVAGDACVVGVFAAGEGGRDGDDGVFGRVGGGAGVGDMGKGHEVGFRVDVVA